MYQRLRVSIRGAVQGVGFRPFIYRLAEELHLKGWVCNTSRGLFIEVEGERQALETFLLRIEKEKPLHAFVQSLEPSFLDRVGYEDFMIRESIEGEKDVLVLPDIAICGQCRSEILDPADRRYLYPFTNCTNCGPRYSIITRVPYDRANTTMKKFVMCDQCRSEYQDPANRRFHAQPNACPKCGPRLEFWDSKGKVLKREQEALALAAECLRDGKIVALKGLGGFQLLADASKGDAVRILRQRKHREAKPFAVMYPNIAMVRRDCELLDMEQRLLMSSEAPIVLVKKRAGCSISDEIAPGNPYLGVMLPYTPLHILMMKELGAPMVATSGNISEEPICTDERQALKLLKGIADVFLVHNRPIARHVDDSIVRVIMGQEMVLRRARGYAPLPVMLDHPIKDVLAVGPHLKNTISVSSKENVFISQHIGDLATERSHRAFKETIRDLTTMVAVEPVAVACDAHPEYLSTKYASALKIPSVTVQHHHAHVLSCMADNNIKAPVLGVSWDGTGYGPDGTIWGGEFLAVKDGAFERVAHFRNFMLPGGPVAVQEPRRSLVGFLYRQYGEKLFEGYFDDFLKSFNEEELANIRTMLQKKINSPRTSSVGRIFDAVASLLDLCHHVQFEGQAAMAVEFLTQGARTDEHYSFDISKCVDGCIDVDGPAVDEMIDDRRGGTSHALIATKFHNTLIEIAVAVARRVRVQRVVFTGGCFQNKYLLENAIHRFRREDFKPYWHQRVPPNDGGISLGQIVAAQKGFSK